MDWTFEQLEGFLCNRVDATLDRRGVSLVDGRFVGIRRGRANLTIREFFTGGHNGHPKRRHWHMEGTIGSSAHLEASYTDSKGGKVSIKQGDASVLYSILMLSWLAKPKPDPSHHDGPPVNAMSLEQLAATGNPVKPIDHHVERALATA